MLKKKPILVLLFLIIFYLVTRLTFLTKLPIFTDEAIYIRWGQIGLQDAAHRFLSLEDGKQPLFIWLMMPALKLISDPLTAGRIVSVISGLLSLIGLIALSWKLFDKKIAWITSLLYIIIPFFLLYDRLALYDSLTTAIMIWSMFFAIQLVKKVDLASSLLFGMAVGAGLLTKSSALFALILLPSTLLLFNRKTKNKKKKISSWLFLALVSGLLALLFQTILRLSPLYHMVRLKNMTFIISISEFLNKPFSLLIGNLHGLIGWAVIYLTAPFSALLVLGTAFGFQKYRYKSILLLSWFAVPFLSLAAFGKVLYPRFILFMIAPLLPLVALGAVSLWKQLTNITSKYHLPKFVICHLSFVILLAYPLYFSSQIIFNPINSPLPLVDRNQFIDDWPSGYGIPEIIEIIKEKSQNQQIFVGTEGTFGLTPTALIIYLHDNPNVEIKGYWPIDRGIAELKDIAATGKPTFLLFKDTQTPPPDWPLQLISKYRKGRGNVFSSFYQVLPDS